jgi:LacI family transcriptional regulator
MTATIKDVAKKAKVSVATVSLVIHNHQRISPETKTKVRKAIRELDYHPTRSARGLVSKRTGNLGFIVTEDHFLRSEPFYTKIFLGTEFQARENEYYVLLTTVSSQFDDKEILPRFVLERNVEGIIIAGKVPTPLLHQLESYKIPLLFIDYTPYNANYPVVMIDNIAGGTLATEHLIQCGHHHIAFVAGDIDHPSIRDRFIGYKMALDKAGISFESHLTLTDAPYPDRDNGYKLANRLLNQAHNFTAVFACNDAMAIGILQCLKEKKLRVPEDVSLIGFDDVEADLSLDPPLTTIKVPKVDMGIEAVKLMIDILQEKSRGPRKILMPVELVTRKSTCPISGR